MSTPRPATASSAPTAAASTDAAVAAPASGMAATTDAATASATAGTEATAGAAIATDAGVLAAVRGALGRPPGADVTFTGARDVLPSMFDVTGFAAGTVAAATAAAAELLAARCGEREARPVRVDRRAAAAAFRTEALLAPVGWELPAVWDLIAGDYACADGWIRLHTNYAAHRDAALRVLGLDPAAGIDRERVAAAVARWAGAELEGAVVAEGGCAAEMRDADAWRAHPAGIAAAAEPLVRVERRRGATAGVSAHRPERALAGLRVLDLTRVLAGPVCTRFLAAHGAEVVRVDPPGFAEVPAVVPFTAEGKRAIGLDLRSPGDRDAFERLVADADVLVCGLRPGALDGLGFDAARLAALNPEVVVARLDAYGWTGPWAGRRGFDSLVQMSCGIAAAGRAAAGGGAPRPLPAQALDHGMGFLLAAAVCTALAERECDGTVATVATSLVATAAELMRHPGPGLDVPAPVWTDADTVPVQTWWGPARTVPVPGEIAGVGPASLRPAGPLGLTP